jgi:hypothetical protein
MTQTTTSVEKGGYVTQEYQEKMKGKGWETYENSERTSRNPSPISACDVSILRVVLFDSTQTQGSSKYFLFK